MSDSALGRFYPMSGSVAVSDNLLSICDGEARPVNTARVWSLSEERDTERGWDDLSPGAGVWSLSEERPIYRHCAMLGESEPGTGIGGGYEVTGALCINNFEIVLNC